ncbi:MAG: DNA polymerase III subunit gamma/tau [Myxococcales bacterium]|nr:DNA polymerase III subunit gamma/tau [Myxococcales bacterium]
MAYLVLARKYRPAGLSELVGQDHIRRALSNALAMKRIPHALLFCGARGTGKTSTARIIAKMLNCQDGPTDAPCGTCSACKEITSGTSVDVQELDAASNRGIDEVRELRSGVGYAPQRDRFKIYIVDEAHMLTDAAANAFLKTLEEPPPHVVFVLATTDPQKLPITIRSRCQRYDFRRVKAQDVVKRLAYICEAEGIAYDQDALYLVAREGDGSMRDSLSLLDQVIAFGGDKLDTETVASLLGVADRGRMHLLLRSLIARDATGALVALGAANDYGLDLRTLARSLAMEARDVLLVRLAGTTARQLVDRSDSEIDQLRSLSDGALDGDLERLSHVLLELAEQAARARYPRLVLELGAVRLCRVAQLADVAELTARVEALLAAGPRLVGRSGPSGAAASGAPPAAACARPAPSSAGHHAATSAGAPTAPSLASPSSPNFGVPVATGHFSATSPTVQESKNLLRPPLPQPPAPMAPVASKPSPRPTVSDADLARLRRVIVQDLGKPAEASLIDSLVVARCSDGELDLGVANDFLLLQATRPETLQLLSVAAAAAFGGTWQVRVMLDVRARTDSASARHARAAELEKVSAEASLRSNPAVRATVAALEGAVVAVHLNSAPSTLGTPPVAGRAGPPSAN